MTNDDDHSLLLRNLLPLKPVDFLLLAVLQDGPMHGYGLVKAMAERSDGCVTVRAGDLYRVLYRLAEQDLVSSPAPASSAERRRTEYRLTDFGHRVLRAEASRLAGLAGDVLARTQTAGEA